MGGIFTSVIAKSNKREEKIKVLNQKGQLVEVDKKVFDKVQDKATVSHEEIIE